MSRDLGEASHLLVIDGGVVLQYQALQSKSFRDLFDARPGLRRYSSCSPVDHRDCIHEGEGNHAVA